MLASLVAEIQVVQVCNNSGSQCTALGPGDVSIARPNEYAYEDVVNEIWSQADIQFEFSYRTWNNSAALNLTASEMNQLLNDQWTAGGTPPPALIDGLQFFFTQAIPSLNTINLPAGFDATRQGTNAGQTQLGLPSPLNATPTGRGVMVNAGVPFSVLGGTLAHEIGHALGLRHIGNPGLGSVGDPTVNLPMTSRNLMWEAGAGPPLTIDLTPLQSFPLTTAQINAVRANGTNPLFDADGNGQPPLKDAPDLTPPVVRIVSTNQTVSESRTEAIDLVIAIDKPAATEVSGNLAVGGNAIAEDFELPISSFVIAAGQSQTTLSINVLDNARGEPTRQIDVTLSNVSGATLSNESRLTITILDDDQPATAIRLVAPSLTAGPRQQPGDNRPTAIQFRATVQTTLSVSSAESTLTVDQVQAFDRDRNSVGQIVQGVFTAELAAGELYALVLPASSVDVSYLIESSAGEETLVRSGFLNLLNPNDVNADGQVTAVDALRVINRLNSLDQTDGGNDDPSTTASQPMSFEDVNGDGSISAVDALRVINHLNAQDGRAGSTAQSEPIPVSPPFPALPLRERLGRDTRGNHSLAEASRTSVKQIACSPHMTDNLGSTVHSQGLIAPSRTKGDANEPALIDAAMGQSSDWWTLS
ncbi:Dockerin type I repeat protein [Neorhodopirellula pilleata]|uniref:Dockerin type I repeat protein n=1 Tax=Neorhodopirellula pilleata TaxID=2714738 RepID=A0A5C5ZXU0_9BACT|nr:Dockerin type I repeat protein [Neorhodopirellula pilleata]